MNEQNQISKKRSLITTFVLLGYMLATTPKKGSNEEEFSQVPSVLFDETWEGFPLISPFLEELTTQGFLETVDGKYRTTKFGEKMALQATHNQPDFQRLADNNINVAFAMLIAAYKALEVHLKEQTALVSGQTQLVQSIQDCTKFLCEKLGFEMKPLKKK